MEPRLSVWIFTQHLGNVACVDDIVHVCNAQEINLMKWDIGREDI